MNRPLESKCQTAADPALLLGKHQDRTVAQKVGLVALRKQIAQIEQCLKAVCPISAEANRLAKVKVEVGLR